MPGLPARLTALLLFAVFGLCAYRARTQSFTVDEAYVFDLFVNRPLAEMAQTYDACNHVLHTLLMKLARATLGTGELALRVPSLLAAALFLRGLYLLTQRFFTGWWQPLVAASAALHPLVLDHLVAARGYGLGLALLIWSLLWAGNWLTRGFADRDLVRAGSMAGLSIAANLTFLVPAAALGATLLGIAVRPRRCWSVVEKYGVPSIVIAFLFNVLPLLRSGREHFYVGEHSWYGSVLSFVQGALKANRAFTFGWAAQHQPFLVGVGVALFWLMTAGAFIVFLRSRWSGGWFHRMPAMLFAFTLFFAVLILTSLFVLAAVPLPQARTGIYLLPLLPFALVAVARSLAFKSVKAGAAATLAVGVLFYVSQMEARFFQEWRFDAATRSMLRRIDEDRQARGKHDEVRLSVSNDLLATIKYYRLRRSMNWLPEQPAFKNLDKSDTDYYLLVEQDAGVVDRLGLTVLYRDRMTGVVLARSES
ncbi:MAG TPA: hypothetical protein VES20_13850 [Bryobacteraceae bacterium]|nr:hypothetical protein [Bryobacteraceae bacterium]